jgi:hypothetical protein
LLQSAQRVLNRTPLLNRRPYRRSWFAVEAAK